MVHGGSIRGHAGAQRQGREAVPKGRRALPVRACPFCNKVKAFLDYYKIPYKVVEVNPISKKEIKWSYYRKVPIVTVEGGKQLNDSSVIIDELLQKLQPGEFPDDVEEKKWRGWVDNRLVHVLSPNIYRSPSEALESFDYITTHGYFGLCSSNTGNFTFMERLIAKYTGAAAMYMVAKKLKKRHNIDDNVLHYMELRKHGCRCIERPSILWWCQTEFGRSCCPRRIEAYSATPVWQRHGREYSNW